MGENGKVMIYVNRKWRKMVSSMDFMVNGYSRIMLKFQKTGFHLENMFYHSDGTRKESPKFGILVPISKLLEKSRLASHSRHISFVSRICEINIKDILKK